MYKTRIKRWGLKKNFSSRDIPEMLHKKAKDGGVGRRADLIIRGKLVSTAKVDRYLMRTLGDNCSATQSHLPDQGGSAESAMMGGPAKLQWLASPDTLQFPEEMIFFSRQLISGMKHWNIDDDKAVYHWVNELSVAKEHIDHGRFSIAFNTLDRCFKDVRPLLLNCSPVLLVHAYIAPLLLPPEIGQRLLSYAAELTSIVLPKNHPMRLIWQMMRRTGTDQIRGYAWNVLYAYVLELADRWGQAQFLAQLTSWLCSLEGLMGLCDDQMMDRARQKQVGLIQESNDNADIFSMKVQLVTAYMAHGENVVAKLMADEMSCESPQGPGGSKDVSIGLKVGSSHMAFLTALTSGSQEDAVEKGKKLFAVLEKFHVNWPGVSFLDYATWARRHFVRLGLEEEATILSGMLDRRYTLDLDLHIKELDSSDTADGTYLTGIREELNP